MKINETQLENHLFFGRYKIIKKIDQGTFGEVFLGLNTKTKDKVAIKLEPKRNPLHFLQTEAFYLFMLKGFGIPKIEAFGHNERYNILVETLLGKSLNYLFYKNKKFFSTKDVLMMGIQIIERLKFVHSKHLIHRDIKPENFLIGYTDPYIIYLIDFGLAKKYRSSRTGKHVQFSITNRYTGTARYSSLNALKGYAVSRRDDIECVAYILIYFMRGNLPWENIEGKTTVEKYRKIFKLKKLTTPEKLCENLPSEICEFLKYSKSLNFEQEPDYSYCCSLFSNALSKIECKNDLLFSWINDKIIIKKLKEMNSSHYIHSERERKKNPLQIYDMSKRKSSPQTRIYHTLQNSFERMKLNFLYNMNNSSNSATVDENFMSSDKKFSLDSKEQKYVDYKFKNGLSKISSLIANDSSNNNYNNKENNILKYEKENQNQFQILTNGNNSKGRKNSQKINNIYHSYSEKKPYYHKNNLIIEKIGKHKLVRNIIENKNDVILNKKPKNDKKIIKIDSTSINSELKKYEFDKKVKLINIEKNKLYNNNIEDNSLNTLENNLLIDKRKNTKNKNIIRITNIYKTKINDKKCIFNFIQRNKNDNKDINQKQNLSTNYNNPNKIEMISNAIQYDNKYKTINKRNNNIKNILLNNKLTKNSQNLFKKIQLRNSDNNLNNNYFKTSDYNYFHKNLLITNKNNKNINRSINNEIRNNYLKQNEIKNKVNKISNIYENKFNNNIINISNEGENLMYNKDRIYYTNDSRYSFNNKNNINITEENNNKERQKRITPINSLNLSNKQIKNIKLKKNEITKAGIKKLNNCIDYNNIHNIKPKREKNMINSSQTIQNLAIKYLRYNPILKNANDHNKNILLDFENSDIFKIKKKKISNNFNSHKTINIINPSRNKNFILRYMNNISNRINKTKLEQNIISRNLNSKNELNPVKYWRNNNIMNFQKLEQYNTINCNDDHYKKDLI